MVDQKLKKITQDLWGLAQAEAISQIKALVIKSLGEKREVNISCNCGCIGFTGECDCNKDFGYNQHIAEMKEKWK